MTMILVRDGLFTTIAIDPADVVEVAWPSLREEREGVSSVLRMRDGRRLLTLEMRSVLRDRIADALEIRSLPLPAPP